jgi:hypothetical protein
MDLKRVSSGDSSEKKSDTELVEFPPRGIMLDGNTPPLDPNQQEDELSFSFIFDSSEYTEKPLCVRQEKLKAWRMQDSLITLQNRYRFCQVTNACGQFRVFPTGAVTMLQPNARARVRLSTKELQELASMDETENPDWDEGVLEDPSDIESYGLYSESLLEQNEIRYGGGSSFVVLPRKILFLVERFATFY